MTTVSKTIIELEAYDTSVFYQIHNKGVVLHPTTRQATHDKLDYKYHCVACKKKGVVSVEALCESVYIRNHSTSITVRGQARESILVHCTVCPTCNVEWTKSQHESQPRSAQKMVFDNGDILYLFQQVHPTWETAQPVVLQYKLRVEADTGRMRVTKNDRTMYDVVCIRDTLSLLRRYFPEVMYTEEYYISRNQRLKDLFMYSRTANNFFSNLSLNHRRRIYYAYDKHGVKEAYRSILPVGSKWLYALAWENLELLSMIEPLVKSVGPDQLTGLLKALPKIDYDELLKIASLDELGLSSIKIGNLIKKGVLSNTSSWVCNDSRRMFVELKERTNNVYQLPTYRSLSELHELLVRDINQIEDATAKLVNLPVTSLEEYHSPTYSVKIAKTAEDLNLLSRVLNICVASYRKSVLKGDIVIAYVMKDGQKVACLEVNPKKASLVQAKLYENDRVLDDKDIERTVYLWSKQNSLSADTRDVGFELVQQTVKTVSITHVESSVEVHIPELPEDLPF